jgi:hypothetical protein
LPPSHGISIAFIQKIPGCRKPELLTGPPCQCVVPLLSATQVPLFANYVATTRGAVSFRTLIIADQLTNPTKSENRELYGLRGLWKEKMLL